MARAKLRASKQTIPGRKRRKRSARATKTGKKSPHTSATWKRLWADPVYRARMTELNREKSRAAVAAGKTRLGIPDGYTRKAAEAANAAARAEAENIVKELEANGEFDDLAPEDREHAKEAMKLAVEGMRSPKNEREKLSYIQTVLKYTKQLPTVKKDIALNPAEAWLARIAAMEDAEEDAVDAAEAAGDTEETA